MQCPELVASHLTAQASGKPRDIKAEDDYYLAMERANVDIQVSEWLLTSIAAVGNWGFSAVLPPKYQRL